MAVSFWNISCSPAPLSLKLHNEQTFYRAFLDDLACCRHGALLESPFLTTRRVKVLLLTVRKLVACGVRITLNTRDPQEHGGYLKEKAESCVDLLRLCGVAILFTGGHCRKLATLDHRALYEGSLNTLSQNESSGDRVGSIGSGDA